MFYYTFIFFLTTMGLKGGALFKNIYLRIKLFYGIHLYDIISFGLLATYCSFLSNFTYFFDIMLSLFVFYGSVIMNFMLIVLSGVLDIFANLALQKSDGFRKIWWGVLALVLVGMAFLLLAVATDNGMSLPIAYTLWGAIGILGSVAGAYYFFQQKLKPIGYVGIVLVVIAVVLLQS